MSKCSPWHSAHLSGGGSRLLQGVEMEWITPFSPLSVTCPTANVHAPQVQRTRGGTTAMLSG
ncbi:MAG: hypothetical protein WCN81_08090, partial [Actinomycetes bacterium]